MSALFDDQALVDPIVAEPDHVQGHRRLRCERRGERFADREVATHSEVTTAPG